MIDVKATASPTVLGAYEVKCPDCQKEQLFGAEDFPLAEGDRFYIDGRVSCFCGSGERFRAYIEVQDE